MADIAALLSRCDLLIGTDWGAMNVGAFVFQAGGGIRGLTVTGVQTCALPILNYVLAPSTEGGVPLFIVMNAWVNPVDFIFPEFLDWSDWSEILTTVEPNLAKGGGRYHVGIGRASCRERV